MNVLKMHPLQLMIYAFFFILNKTSAICDYSKLPLVKKDSKPVVRFSTLTKNRERFCEYRTSSLEYYLPEIPKITVLNRNVLSIKPVYWMVGVYLYGKGITIVERGTFEYMSNLRTLDLSNNNISILKPGVFEGAPRLKTLNLSNNKIYYLFDYCFMYVNLLENLDLANNKIDKIETKVFRDLNNLQRLQLNNNSLKLLDYKLFRNLNELTDLDLSSNALLDTYYDENIIIMLKLKILNLTNNFISRLPTFMKVNSLQVLSLNNNNFADLNVAFLKVLYPGLIYIEILKNNWTSCERLRDIQEELMQRMKVHFVKENICNHVYFEKDVDDVELDSFRKMLLLSIPILFYFDSFITFTQFCGFVTENRFKIKLFKNQT